jgi:PhnB protein
MTQLSLYLFFNGNCEEAMNFYKETLGGTIEFVQRYGDSPEPGSESNKNKIMHATMNLMGAYVMFSDAMEKRNVQFGDNFSISVNCKSDGDVDRLLDAMSTGGQVTMAADDTFWGARFGMCTDKFGVNWMFNYDKEKK